MKSLMKSAFTMTLLGGIFALGCSSSSSGDDAGTDLDAGSDSGPVLFGITPGDNCFDVVSVQPGFNDGCEIGVGDTVANRAWSAGAMLVNYNPNTAILTVGSRWRVGGGPIAFNTGTLTPR